MAAEKANREIGAAVMVVLAACAGAGGQPTFTATADVTTGDAPTGLVTADLDGDGDQDMAVANWQAGSVQVFRNTAGSFALMTTINLGATKATRTVSAADLAGTTLPDLVVANEGGSVTLIQNNGGFSFTVLTDWNIAPGSSQATAGDFGGTDAVVGVQGGADDQMSSRVGDGTGGYPGFDNRAACNEDPIALAMADFNGDGKPDIAVLNRTSATVSILLWTGNQAPSGPGGLPGGIITSLSQTLTVGANPRSIVAARLNAGTAVDLAVACAGDNTVRVFLGTGTGTFTTGTTITGVTNPAFVAAGDLDRDGDQDLALVQNIHAQAYLRGTGVLAGGVDGTSRANAIGDDGVTAVGYSQVSGVQRAVRWTPQSGRQELGSLGTWTVNSGRATVMTPTASVVAGDGDQTAKAWVWRASDSTMRDLKDWLSSAGVSVSAWSRLASVTGITSDGAVVVGNGWNASSQGLPYLARLPGGAPGPQIYAVTGIGGATVSTSVNGISADGAYIVGTTANQAFRRPSASGGVAVGLGFGPGGSTSQGNAISSDGSVVAGITNVLTNKPFRWTAAGGMVVLPTLGLNGEYYFVTDISDDGNTIVGFLTYFIGPTTYWLPWRWTSAGGLVSLPMLPGGITVSPYLETGYSYGVSPNGVYTAGQSSSYYGSQAVRWQSNSLVQGMRGSRIFSRAKDVSADGLWVCGYSETATGEYGFRLSLATDVMDSVGDLAGGFNSSISYGIANGGATVVGFSNDGLENRAVRGMGAGMAIMDLAGGTDYGLAAACSDSGLTIVGEADSAAGFQAFRYISGTTTGLGFLAGGSMSGATAINGAGSIIVGYSNSSSPSIQAFKWTSGTGMVGLGTMVAGGDSFAYGVSSDGSVVVGSGTTAAGNEASRWTSAGGMVALGDLAGGTVNSSLDAVNGAGTVAVGYGRDAAGTQAVIWDGTNGLRSLVSALRAFGVNTSAWQSLTWGEGISSTTRLVLAGYGTNSRGETEGFVAQLPDGYPAVSQASDGVVVLLNNGSAVFTATPLIAVSSSPQSVELRDLTGDQRLDMLVTRKDADRVRVLVNTSCRADWDRDGDIDTADVAGFINTWSASLSGGTLAGDFDGNGIVAPADVSNFVNTWFAALSAPC